MFNCLSSGYLASDMYLWIHPPCVEECESAGGYRDRVLIVVVLLQKGNGPAG
jgi:hypothetical protein